jgi:hypothetical protein
MVDVLPILALGAGLELPRLGRGAAVALGIALVWSVLVQWNGAFCYPASQWDMRLTRSLASDPAAREKAVWDWRQLALWQDFKQWKDWPFWATPY